MNQLAEYAAAKTIVRHHRANGNDELVLTSYMLRQGQHGLIKALAKFTGHSQATVIRAIIDEWATAHT